MTYNQLSLEDWKRRIKFINPEMELLNVVLPKGTDEDPFICHCNKCGATFNSKKSALHTAWYRAKNNMHNNWCPVCTGSLCVNNINDIATVRPDLVIYFHNKEETRKYTIGSNTIIKTECPICHHIKNMYIYDLAHKGFSCNVCSDSISFPNKICRNLILQLPVDDYDFEYTNNNLENKIYDGYFVYNNQKYLLEFDGEQHYRDTQWNTLQYQKANDKSKTEIALKNGFNIIRINCYYSNFDYIKNNIYKSDLINIFDLDLVDWNYIYNKSLESFDLEVGYYYMEHKDLSKADLAKYFHVSRKTMSRIFKRLEKIELFKIDQNEINETGRKRAAQTRINKNDPFYLYSPFGNYLGEFKSSGECYDFLKNNYPELQISERTIRKKLFIGKDCNGYKFIYKNGLKEHHKNNKLLFEICNYYNNHNVQNILKTISQVFNISESKAYNLLSAGDSMNICKYPKNKEAA